MALLIGLTYDLVLSEKTTGDVKDLLAEFDKEETISAIEKALRAFGHRTCRIGSAKELVKALPKLKCDVVFNIAEGLDGRNRESQVPVLLDIFDVPYIGSDALALSVSLDKVLAKKIFRYHGVPTPNYFVCQDSDKIVIPEGILFPLIVKPRHEGSAKGIYPDSKIHDYNELKRRVRLIIKTYRQPALVEEFISGWEFTVGIIGNDNPQILPVVQRHVELRTNLSSHIFDKSDADKKALIYKEFIEIGPQLEAEIKRLALMAFSSIGCRDFARLDFRLSEAAPKNKNKGLYLLEINPLPSLAKDDYFAMAAESMGISYDEIINMILEAALARNRCSRKTPTHILNTAI